MKYGYDLDKRKGIFVEPISLFEYRKQALTPLQRKTLEAANPNLFGKVKNGAFASPPIPNMIQQIPPIVLVEQGLIVKRDTEDQGTQINDFQPIGIAKKFSQLKGTDDIVSFANEYGLLGCELIEHTHILESSMDYLKVFSYHHSYFEPLKVWEWHIDHVKKLFQLYRALRYKTKIEGELLRSEMLPSELPSGGYMPFSGLIYWNDGKLIDHCTLDLVPETKEIDFNKLARNLLVKQLTRMLKGAIDLSYDSIVNDEDSEIGFKLNETRRTRFLLAAIYYDMWHTITNHQEVSVCKVCDASFTSSKRGKYCSDACKQTAYRIRVAEKNKEGGKANGQHSKAR